MMRLMTLTSEEVLRCLKGEADPVICQQFLDEMKDPESLVSKILRERGERARTILSMDSPEILVGEYGVSSLLPAEHQKAIEGLPDDLVQQLWEKVENEEQATERLKRLERFGN